MKNRNRVSQQDLTSVIASAIALEGQRIEQISEKAAEDVGGGGPPTGSTMGYLPPKIPLWEDLG